MHIYAFNSVENNLVNYDSWQLHIKGSWKAIEVLEAKVHGQGLIARLAECETRNAAELLTNIEIGVLREELPKLSEDEYYWVDLIGLEVITEEGVLLGRVESLFETGANDVLVVKNDTREHLLPYIPKDYILDVNLEKKRILVRWDPEF